MASKMVESMKFLPAQVLLPVVYVIDSKVNIHFGCEFISVIRAGSHLRGKRTDSVFHYHAKLHHI